MSGGKVSQSYVGAASHDTRVVSPVGWPGVGIFWDTGISVQNLGKLQDGPFLLQVEDKLYRDHARKPRPVRRYLERFSERRRCLRRGVRGGPG